jgi:UDP-2,3-diacylglucosamine pyrophosphatase LpxH
LFNLLADEMSTEVKVLPDFSKADFTAVVSDLHLSDEQIENKKFPLWKKYKTRQFFFDREFSEFLVKLEGMSGGGLIELVLNGDIFDFDSVMALPDEPPYYVNWLETHRGLHPQEEKSEFKIKFILATHAEWIRGLRAFIMKGHRAIFTIGNHDLELHYPAVQAAILEALELPPNLRQNVRFNEWFYISNRDTLIEHGNQYDPYCMTQDPVRPFFVRFNRIEVRLPFGNLTTRYLINGMGFFNPHLDTNFIMSPREYVQFFLKYMLRAQPGLIITWFWGSVVTLVQSFFDRLRPAISSPLGIEDRVEWIAKKSNATPRMVRQLKELFVAPAASYPAIILRELWLDRALMILMAIALLYFIFLQVDTLFHISIFWAFIPFFLFVPFFLFYARSVTSEVHNFKEPQERAMALAGLIANVGRIIYGHTHIVRHEMIGPIEHLNSGTWSPAFADVECEKPVGQKTFVWIYPGENGQREARVYLILKGEIHEVFGGAGGGKTNRQHMGPASGTGE